MIKTCDAYSDLWEPSFALLKRNWPDCPFPIYHVSNNKEIAWSGVQSVRVGPRDGHELSWSDTLLAGLAKIPEPFVLMILEDLFLLERVQTHLVREAIEWLEANGGNHLRLDAHPKPDGSINDIVAVIPPGSVYRTSTVLTVWRKSVLCDLLRSRESIWEFEMAGAVRSDKYDGFYSTLKPLLSVENTVIKGKWRRSSIRKLRKLGLDLQIRDRPVMTFSEDLLINTRMRLHKLLRWLPLQWRRSIHSLWRRAGYAQSGAHVVNP